MFLFLWILKGTTIQKEDTEVWHTLNSLGWNIINLVQSLSHSYKVRNSIQRQSDQGLHLLCICRTQNSLVKPALIKWASTWQNQQCGCAPIKDSDQPGHLPSLISVFAVHMKKAWVLSYPLSAQRRLWSDWADAQADLSLRWVHIHFAGFVMSRLKCSDSFEFVYSTLTISWAQSRKMAPFASCFLSSL